MDKFEYIKIAKKSANIQITELKKINKIFDKSFIKAVDLMLSCKGKVITAGIGKSGLIARKISATLSSVGVSSFFLNPSEANHGDLGDKKTSNEWCQTWQAMGAQECSEYMQLAGTLESSYQVQKDEFSRMGQYKVRACVVTTRGTSPWLEGSR